MCVCSVSVCDCMCYGRLDDNFLALIKVRYHRHYYHYDHQDDDDKDSCQIKRKERRRHIDWVGDLDLSLLFLLSSVEVVYSFLHP